jgi:DNA polymerase-1
VISAPSALASELAGAGVAPGDFLALTIVPGRGLAVCHPVQPANPDATLDRLRRPGIARLTANPVAVVGQLETDLHPRWVWWDSTTARQLTAGGVRVQRCWDLAAVHRLLFGGWASDPGRVWAALHQLAEASLPVVGQLDLLGHSGDSDGDFECASQPDGHLRPAWINGAWTTAETRWESWVATAARAFESQHTAITIGGVSTLDSVNPSDSVKPSNNVKPSNSVSPSNDTARRLAASCRSESAAELLCAELERDGLPVDRHRAEQLIGSFVGPRPSDEEQAREIRRQRDGDVLVHVPGIDVDLRSPAQVKAMLARVGIEVADTRSWRLEVFREAHPVVPALLRWRKDERMSTTYGYGWLDTHVGADGRLRGSWTSCDGGAGRMTASAGLHSLPSELRDAVRADPGHCLVRADLGQIEPRVLAAVSGDRSLAAATVDHDLYAPVAARLGVTRPVAKVAVLAAMYGQTSGAAGEALKNMDRAYPMAMRHLREADEAGRAAQPLRTYGGRLLRMWPNPSGLDDQQLRSHIAGRGRFARNAVVQGAAAELFKAWAATVRIRARSLEAQIVLCLHDELLIQVPQANAPVTVALLHASLAEAAERWTGGRLVHFVAEVTVAERWSQAKP